MRCPSVKAIEYFEDGVTVKRVEFMTAPDFPVAVGVPNPNISATYGDGMAFDSSGRPRA